MTTLRQYKSTSIIIPFFIMFIITNTEEIFEEQDEMEDMAADSKIMLFPPFKEVLQVWKHYGTDLWSPLQDLMWTPIPSNQKSLACHSTSTIHADIFTMCYRITGANSSEFLKQKETYCLLCISVL
jgi:hypothetical protein